MLPQEKLVSNVAEVNDETKTQVLLGFEPRISCLLERHFNHLSHSTDFKELVMLEQILLIRSQYHSVV